jgi:hypothetical protein
MCRNSVNPVHVQRLEIIKRATTFFKRRSRTCFQSGGRDGMKEYRKRCVYMMKTDHTSSSKLKIRYFTG